MLVNLLLVAVLLGITVALFWLAWHAWHQRSVVLRVLGTLLVGLLGVVFLMLTAVMARGMYRVYTPRNTPVPDLQVRSTPERIARGQYLALTTCAACHARNGQLPLTGGANLADDSGLPVGALYPANLTPAGDLPKWSDGQILRALREGIDRQGIPLVGMPAANLRNMSDEAAASIIAYLRSQPAAGTKAPQHDTWPLGLLMAGAGIFDPSNPPVAGPITAPSRATDAAYGEYVVSFSDCRSCHGADLKGGQPPAPQGPNLKIVSSWTTRPVH